MVNHNLIMKNSVGNFFYPNPNRLVVNKGGSNGILHKINNTTVDSSPRFLLQCFIRLADTDDLFQGNTVGSTMG